MQWSQKMNKWPRPHHSSGGLVAGFPPRWPRFKPGSGHVGFCDGQKWRWGRFSPRTSVSPVNLYSICFSTIIFTITRCWHNRPGVTTVPIASLSHTHTHTKIKWPSSTIIDPGNHMIQCQGKAYWIGWTRTCGKLWDLYNLSETFFSLHNV
jgi:hypothetical protein